MFAPVFQITHRILNHISRIEAAQEVIHHSPILPYWEKEFRQDAIVRQVHHGTHIEGNQLGIEDARDILRGKDVIGRPRDVQEVINYRKVIDYIDDFTTHGRMHIHEMTIKALHKILVHKVIPDEQAGVYRTKQVVIRNSRTGEVTFRPPDPLQVDLLMSELVYWLEHTSHNEIHPVLKAAIAHHRLAWIHPFIDGNGRVSRLIATLIMVIEGYDMRRFFSLEEYYDKDAVSYYEALQKASGGDLTAWLEYFTFGAAVEFDKVKEKILKLSQDVKLKTKIGEKQIYVTERQTKIIQYITDVGYIQNKMFLTLFPDVSDDTVLREVQDLVKKGLIHKVGSTKAARYELAR